MFLDISVTLTNQNEACIDIGLLDLNSKEECQAAFKKETGSSSSVGNVNMPNRPPGCFYHSTSTFYWNNDPTGDGSSCSCKSVCHSCNKNATEETSNENLRISVNTLLTESMIIFILLQ